MPEPPQRTIPTPMLPNPDPGAGPDTGSCRIFQPPNWDWAQAGEIGWWVRPDWRESLIGPGGLRLSEWRADGALTTIKTGPHRVVYRAQLPDRGAIYVKHFLVPNVPSILRQWFRRGKGRNEAKRAARLTALGVPTITPIALGEQRRRKFLFENYLITPELAGTVPLDVFLASHLQARSEPDQSRLRRRLAEALGDLTARLHEGGFLHADFHAGNVLVHVGGDGEPRLAMIDLDALRVHRRLRPRDALANLALLNHSFWLSSSRTDRHRFLLAYRRGRRADLGDPKAVAREIEAATRTWAERMWRRWGRRCLGESKYFATYQGCRTWAVAHRDLDPTTVRGILRDPDAPFAHPEAVKLKDSRTTTVIDVPMTVRGVSARVIYKRFNRKKWLDPLLTLFRPSRAWRAWRNGQHLASRAVPTPRNLAVIGRAHTGRRFLLQHFLPHDSYLVTIKLEPARTLGEYARDVLPSLNESDRRAAIRRFLPALAQLLRTLHERSLSHRDLKADNILIAGDEDAARPELSLIDLVGVELDHPLSRHHRVQNLARIQLSLAHVAGRTRTDGLRFLRLYLGATRTRTLHSAWKDLWREIDDACYRKTRQNRRNQRKLT